MSKKSFKSKRLSRFLFVILVFGLTLGLPFYLFKQERYYTALPLKLTSLDIPYVEVNIDGADYPLEIDLGSRLETSIYLDVLNQLERRPYGVEKWINFEGTTFEYPTFLIQNIKIGSLKFKDPVVVASPRDRDNEYLIGDDPKLSSIATTTVGDLGRGLLKKINFLLDVENSKMIITNSPKRLKDDGYSLAKFVKVPFHLEPKGIVIEADTDLGKIRLILDTGCTWTIVHKHLYPKEVEKDNHDIPMLTLNHFKLDRTNFRKQDLHFIDLGEELSDIDGLLGMDFIKNHSIYIDFNSHLLYIKK